MYKFEDVEISPVLESYLFELRSVQEPKNMIKYNDRALESITASSGEMLQKLYSEVLAKNTYDFSLISDSKGDISRYKGYNNIYGCIEYLNTLYEKANSKGSRELVIMNKLHDMILSLRGDFVFGYKTDVQLIKIVYENMVLTLHQLTNICIIMYMDYLKDVNKKPLSKFNSGTKDLIIVNSATKLIAMNDSGEWLTVMREFKKDPKGFFGAAVTTGIGLGIGVSQLGGPDAVGKQLKGLSKVIGAVPGVIGTAIKHIPGPAWIKPLAKYSIILAEIILAVRGCVYVYHKLPIKIKDFAKTESEFIRVNSEGDLSKMESKVVNLLDRVAGTEEVKIIKSNAEASVDLERANVMNHSLSSEDSIELF